MAHSILIDIQNMKIIAASKQDDSAKCLAIIADLVKAPDNHLIIGIEDHWFKERFTFEEMKRLYSNTSGDEIKRALPETVLYGCVRLAEHFPIDERSSNELLTELGRPFITSKLPIPERNINKSSSSEKSYNRPKEGTTTRRVWDICDEMKKDFNEIPKKYEVVDSCVKEGINPSTASTQYSKWRNALTS